MKDKKLIGEVFLKVSPVFLELVLILVVASFLPRDLLLILYFSLGILTGVAIAMLWWFDKGDSDGLAMLYLFVAVGSFFLVFVKYAFFYTWIDSIWLFLLIAVAVSLPIAFLFVKLWFRKTKSSPDYKQRKKRQPQYGGVENPYAVFFGVLFIAAALLFTTAVHLNYLLDADEPQSVTATILNKKHRHSFKAGSSHTFVVKVDGETVNLEVGDDYDEYEIGDTYTFDRYEGAFGIAFYLPDKSESTN